MAQQKWYVYILKCSDTTLYTGITTDLKRRVCEHNAGKGARYTRGRVPVRIMYSKCCKDKTAALQREAAIKKMPRNNKLTLIRTKKIT